MNTAKSSRHAKISGNFGEVLLLYWLSKHGFECASVDHTGIDIIALNPKNKELMGISVKCRTRKDGTETESTTIRGGEFANVDKACADFKCNPYFAIVVDSKNIIRVFITSKDNFLRHAPRTKNSNWRMSDEALKLYANDPQVMAFEFNSTIKRWWW